MGMVKTELFTGNTNPSRAAACLWDLAARGKLSNGYLELNVDEMPALRFAASEEPTAEVVEQGRLLTQMLVNQPSGFAERVVTITQYSPVLLRISMFWLCFEILVQTDQGEECVLTASSACASAQCPIWEVRESDSAWMSHPKVRQALQNFIRQAEPVLRVVRGSERAAEQARKRQERETRRREHLSVQEMARQRAETRSLALGRALNGK